MERTLTIKKIILLWVSYWIYFIGIDLLIYYFIDFHISIYNLHYIILILFIGQLITKFQTLYYSYNYDAEQTQFATEIIDELIEQKLMKVLNDAEEET